ncbi:3TM-type holin [Paraburkholderia tropica]|uniref:Holin of 3TMs, for gene-transfer release n=1 Tax=Paraburkholderia tropica TaxID=92647 RepID=A0AAQ1GJ95_9BURK|nr:3TM-type holin [Paraburkholderia tropica]SEK02481.1 Holin of 3TMs, for gene-transfer release [Paraburkholderia tropica]
MAALDPITAVSDLATTIVQRIWPDKTQQEQQQLAAVLAMVQGQLQINQAEAQSSDPLQHWRGGMGWVCVAGYAWNFVLQPLLNAGTAMFGHPLNMPPLDLSELSTLTLGMLGLGGLHVAERIKGAS